MISHGKFFHPQIPLPNQTFPDFDCFVSANMENIFFDHFFLYERFHQHHSVFSGHTEIVSLETSPICMKTKSIYLPILLDNPIVQK